MQCPALFLLFCVLHTAQDHKLVYKLVIPFQIPLTSKAASLRIIIYSIWCGCCSSVLAQADPMPALDWLGVFLALHLGSF